MTFRKAPSKCYVDSFTIHRDIRPYKMCPHYDLVIHPHLAYSYKHDTVDRFSENILLFQRTQEVSTHLSALQLHTAQKEIRIKLSLKKFSFSWCGN